jgi:hypothetical protein
MQKVDLRKQLKHLYNPSGREVTVVDVPPMNYLMIEGEGNPNTSEDYAHAVEALYAVSYALKFIFKRGADAIDYAVMPLEGLWWADDMTRFSVDDKAAWRWTAMILQPEFVTEELVQEAKNQVEKRKGPLPVFPKMRFESFHEGRVAQIMHHGPYSEEGPTIARLHEFIEERGHELRGKHHEIYLGDPRRTAPERLKTVIRQPFG